MMDNEDVGSDELRPGQFANRAPPKKIFTVFTRCSRYRGVYGNPCRNELGFSSVKKISPRPFAAWFQHSQGSFQRSEFYRIHRVRRVLLIRQRTGSVYIQIYMGISLGYLKSVLGIVKAVFQKYPYHVYHICGKISSGWLWIGCFCIQISLQYREMVHMFLEYLSRILNCFFACKLWIKSV